MPKLSLPQIRALLDDAKAAYKAKFTPDFYHASPSNKIKEFDPTHAPSENGVSLYAGDDKANATFITRDPRFANSMLPAGNAMGYKPGSTVYPVSANLGKHFDYETPEGLSTIKNYLAKKLPVPEGAHVTENDIRQWVRDRSSDHNELKEGSWAAIEHPEFQRHLQDEGYDSFAMQEAGRKNIGIYEPHNIRGKFAEYNPDEAMNPDFMKAEGGAIQAHAPGASRGIAPYGFRHIENTEEVSLPKGSGWLGILPNETGQVSTELSASNDSMSYPMLSPNMSRQEIDSLLANQKPTDEMYSKAEQWAKHRQAQGKSPFISPVGELRYPLPQYAAGGEVLKKVLKFAEDVPFIHYSNHPSLNRLEPSMYGRGIKGQEAARLKDAPDIKDRSYFYVNKGEQTMPPEQGLGSQKYQGTASNVYNAAEDPEGFHAIAKSRALDPYMMSFGREMVDPAVKATELERLIKGAGYEGYHTGDVGLMFHPTPVSKID